MGKKKKAEEHENHERWLVSYADFITLLFAFFVVMYASSARDAEKVKQLEVALVKTFGSYSSGPMEKQNGPPFMDRDKVRPSPVLNRFEKSKEELTPEQIYAENDRLRKLQREVDGLLLSNGAIKGFRTSLTKRGLLLTANRSRLFSPSGDAIAEAYQPALLEIAKRLRYLSNDIRIEGMAAPRRSATLEKLSTSLEAQSNALRRFLTGEGGVSEGRLEVHLVLKSHSDLTRLDESEDGAFLDLVVVREGPQE